MKKRYFELDARGHEGEQDDPYGYLVDIALEHHKIHEGWHFGACFEIVDSDIGDEMEMLIAVGEKEVHLRGIVQATKPGTVKLFESPTVGAAGTAVTTNNNDRTSANVSTATITHTPTITDNGDELDAGVFGTTGASPNGGVGGIINRPDEWILAPHTSYLLQFIPLANTAHSVMNLKYYEVDSATTTTTTTT